MWEQMPIVVIDDKSPENNVLQSQLNFIGEKSVVYTSGSWQKDIEDSLEILTFVIDINKIACRH